MTVWTVAARPTAFALVWYVFVVGGPSGARTNPRVALCGCVRACVRALRVRGLTCRSKIYHVLLQSKSGDTSARIDCKYQQTRLAKRTDPQYVRIERARFPLWSGRTSLRHENRCATRHSTSRPSTQATRASWGSCSWCVQGENSVLNFCCGDWLGSIQLGYSHGLSLLGSHNETKRNEPRRPEHTHLSPYRRRDERGTDACASNGVRVWTKAWSAIPSFQTSVRSRSPVPGFHRESNHGNETEGHAVRCEGWRGSGGRFCS